MSDIILIFTFSYIYLTIYGILAVCMFAHNVREAIELGKKMLIWPYYLFQVMFK